MKLKILVSVILIAMAFLVIGPVTAEAEPSISVTPTQGPSGTPIELAGAGFPPGEEATVQWWTMEGNRVSGSGYEPVSWDMGTTTVNVDGEISFTFTAPKDLGGVIPHKISVMVDGNSEAEALYFLERRITISPTSGPEGTVVKFEMESGGWTQYDNIVAITYDNSFIGYACSFTNQGHIAVWFQAMGAVGAHIIGIYPSPWTGPSSWDPQSNPTPWKHAALNTDDIPTIYEPELFTFEITESTRGTRSVLGGAEDLHEVIAGDSLAIVQAPAVPIEDGTPHLTVGNGGQGVVDGDLPYALAGFPANAHVVLGWVTRDGVSNTGGEYNDKHLGWTFTETYMTLGEVDVDGEGRALGTLKIPHDFGGDHIIEAVVEGEVLADAIFKIVQRFTASLSEDGSEVILHATGLGWEKYTAAWDVLYDAKLFGWITAMTTRGSADVSIPVVGEPGLHTIEIHEGQNGFPFLNMHETSWPWTRAYRFAFTIPGSPEEVGSEGEDKESTLPISIVLPLIISAVLIGVVLSYVGGHLRSTRTEKEIGSRTPNRSGGPEMPTLKTEATTALDRE